MNKRAAITIILCTALALFGTAMTLISSKVGIVIAVYSAIVLLIFFKPFAGIIIYSLHLLLYPQYFIPILKNMRSMLILASIILTCFFIHNVAQRKKIHFLSPTQNMLTFVLLIIILLSNVVNFRFEAAWDGFNEFLTVYLLYFMIVNIVDDFRRLRVLSWVFVSTVTVLAINGIQQYYHGTDFMGISAGYGNRIVWLGNFGDPNDFALLMLSFFPFLLVNMFEPTMKKMHRFGLFVLAIPLLAAIYFTNSRGGFTALMACIAFFSLKRWGLLRGLSVATILVILGIMMGPSRMNELSPYESSASGRINAWIAGLGFLKHRPILGIGYMNFGPTNGIAAHSAYVACFSELGFIGYFVWLALIYTCFIGLIKVEKGAPAEYRKYSRILQLSLVTFLVSAIFLSQTYSPILYILIALSVIIISGARADEGRGRFLSSQDTLAVVGLEVMTILGYKVLARFYH